MSKVTALFLLYFILFTIIIAAPSTTRTTPVARFSVFAETLFAISAAMRAKTRVLLTHVISATGSGAPPIAKWLTEPVRAVAALL